MDLAIIQQKATAELERIKQHYALENKQYFAFAAMSKLMEECGELAEAALAMNGLQRKEKLECFTKEHLEKEFVDVLFVITQLASLFEVDINAVAEKRIKEITQRTM